MEERKMHLVEDAGPLTARRVIDLAKDPGLRDDDYHRQIIEAAYRLNRNGFGYMMYQTSWGLASLWKDTERGGQLTVGTDGTLS